MTVKRWKCPKCKKEMMTEGSVRARFHGDCGVWMKCVEEVKERVRRVQPPRKPSVQVRSRPRVVFELDEAEFPEFGFWGEGGTS